jgi:hypothetical protein
LLEQLLQTDDAALLYDQSFRKLRQGDSINVKWNHINSEFYLDALSLGLTNKMKTVEQQLFLAKSKPNITDF